MTLLSGRNVLLSIVSLEDKIIDVKRHIEHLIGSSLQNQKMLFNDNTLNDQDALSKIGVKDGSKFKMVDSSSRKKDKSKEGKTGTKIYFLIM